LSLRQNKKNVSRRLKITKKICLKKLNKSTCVEARLTNVGVETAKTKDRLRLEPNQLSLAYPPNYRKASKYKKSS